MHYEKERLWNKSDLLEEEGDCWVEPEDSDGENVHYESLSGEERGHRCCGWMSFCTVFSSVSLVLMVTVTAGSMAYAVTLGHRGRCNLFMDIHKCEEWHKDRRNDSYSPSPPPHRYDYADVGKDYSSTSCNNTVVVVNNVCSDDANGVVEVCSNNSLTETDIDLSFLRTVVDDRVALFSTSGNRQYLGAAAIILELVHTFVRTLGLADTVDEFNQYSASIKRAFPLNDTDLTVKLNFPTFNPLSWTRINQAMEIAYETSNRFVGSFANYMTTTDPFWFLLFKSPTIPTINKTDFFTALNAERAMTELDYIWMSWVYIKTNLDLNNGTYLELSRQDSFRYEGEDLCPNDNSSISSRKRDIANIVQELPVKRVTSTLNISSTTVVRFLENSADFGAFRLLMPLQNSDLTKLRDFTLFVIYHYTCQKLLRPMVVDRFMRLKNNARQSLIYMKTHSVGSWGYIRRFYVFQKSNEMNYLSDIMIKCTNAKRLIRLPIAA